MKEFKEVLKELRKKRGLTQMELGEILNSSDATVSRYESGKQNPTLDEAKRIAAYFDVPLSFLLGEEPEDFQQYDPEALEILEILNRNDELRVLFKKTGKLSKEDMEQIVRIMKATLPPEYNE